MYTGSALQQSIFQLTIHTGLSLQGSIITETIKNCYQKGSSMIKPCSPQQCFCNLYIITMAVKQFSPPYNLHGANDMVQNYRKLFTKKFVGGSIYKIWWVGVNKKF